MQSTDCLKAGKKFDGLNAVTFNFRKLLEVHRDSSARHNETSLKSFTTYILFIH